MPSGFSGIITGVNAAMQQRLWLEGGGSSSSRLNFFLKAAKLPFAH